MGHREGYVPVGDGLRLYWQMDGAEDLIPLESSREWAAALPNARLLLIPDAGHMPAIEAPEVFFPAADRFLRGAWPEQAEMVTGAS
jgi:hypothetical protein